MHFRTTCSTGALRAIAYTSSEMCGRFVLENVEGLVGRFRLRWVGTPTRRIEVSEWAGQVEGYNIRPTNTVAAIANPGGERQLELMRWGLIPFWWKQADPPKFATFNARDDKLTSGTWREPVKRSRCLVPAHGFYEWTGPKGRRVPHYIHRIDGEPFAFAGLADTWTTPATGELVRSCSIITTSPNEFMRAIHNRMPVVLPDSEAEALWIDPETTRLEDVTHLVSPYEWAGMTEHVVAPLRGDGPHLIEPTTPD